MDWIQLLVLVGSLCAFLWYFITRIERDFALFKSEMRDDINLIRAEMTANNQRVDRLYQMFVDLLQNKH